MRWNSIMINNYMYSNILDILYVYPTLWYTD